MNRRQLLCTAGVLTVGACAARPSTPSQAGQTVWVFDNLRKIGGFAPLVEGAPRLTNSPYGAAIAFDGVDDALFLPNHPLAGRPAFTFQALFRPDGGAREQRWFHLQEDPHSPDAPSGGTRCLFEVRVEDQEWWLDSFVKGPGYNQTLVFPTKRHPVKQWFHVAQTYDGRWYRAYVDGVLEGEAEIAFTPQGPGQSSVGCRINRIDYFQGAIREARFTSTALAPDQFSRR